MRAPRTVVRLVQGVVGLLQRRHVRPECGQPAPNHGMSLLARGVLAGQHVERQHPYPIHHGATTTAHRLRVHHATVDPMIARSLAEIGLLMTTVTRRVGDGELVVSVGQLEPALEESVERVGCPDPAHDPTWLTILGSGLA